MNWPGTLMGDSEPQEGQGPTGWDIGQGSSRPVDALPLQTERRARVGQRLGLWPRPQEWWPHLLPPQTGWSRA